MPHSPADDQQAQLLLERVAQRGSDSQQAFGQLYDLLSGRVYGMCLRVLVDPDLARETSQEAWLEVWEKARNFQSHRGSAAAWTLRIAHHRAVDVVRHTTSLRNRQAAEAARTDAPPLTPPEIVASRQERQSVGTCLEALTPRQRQALVLAYYGGMTQRDIASQLELSLPAVKSRMRDGLIALKRCVEQ